MSVAPELGRHAANSGARLKTLDARGRTSNIGKDGPHILMARLELYPNA